MGEIVCKTVKLHALRSGPAADIIPMSQTVAVVMAQMCIPMIQAASLGIAFCAKPKTCSPPMGYQRPRPDARTRLSAPVDRQIITGIG